MSKPTPIIAAMSLLAVMCTPVSAQPARGQRAASQQSNATAPALTADDLVERLMHFDRNRDGKVSIDEVPERMRPLITRGDSDGDDAVTRTEADDIESGGNGQTNRTGRLAGPGAGPSDAVFDAIDTDGDRALSGAELRNTTTALRTLDRDNDGLVGTDELSRRRGAAVTTVAQQGPRRPGSRQTRSATFAAIDADGDGALSRTEIRNAARVLSHLDTDGDGRIQVSEVSQRQQAARRPRSRTTRTGN